MVHTYHRIQRATPSIIEGMLLLLTTTWNKSSIGKKFKLSTFEAANRMAYVRSYDIWDYEVNLSGSDADVPSIKALFQSSEQNPIRELAAIASMDISDVDSLKDVRIDTFIETDIGTRDDELWAIGSERMTRRHPDRKFAHNSTFFEDVRLASEVMLGYQCTTELLEEWVSIQRTALLDKLIKLNDLKENEQNDLQKSYTDVVRASQMLVEPLTIERGVKHSFFKITLNALADKMEIVKNVNKSSQTMTEFAGFVESIAGFQYAQLNASLGDIQNDLAELNIELAKTSKKLGWFSLIIAAFGVALVVVQMLMNFKNNKEIQTVPSTSIENSELKTVEEVLVVPNSSDENRQLKSDE